MAPYNANLFMGKLKQVLLQTQHRAPLVWWRCVDDILAIWTHGEAALQEVLASLNQHHTTIKITATWSAEEVTFLHTGAYKDHHIKMDLHVKPTDTCQYLQIINCTIAITYSQEQCCLCLQDKCLPLGECVSSKGECTCFACCRSFNQLFLCATAIGTTSSKYHQNAH